MNEAEKTIDTTVATAGYTTLPQDKECVFKGEIYVRRVHDQAQAPEGWDIDPMKWPFPANIEKQYASKWLFDAAKKVWQGKSLILITYQVSERTFQQRNLFRAIFAKVNIQHTDTDSKTDRVFDLPQDVELRNEWMAYAANGINPVFIRMQEMFPDVYADLKQRDGQPIELHYKDGVLKITLPDVVYELPMVTIKHEIAGN